MTEVVVVEEGEMIEIHLEEVAIMTTHLALQIALNAEKLVIFLVSVLKLDKINVSNVEVRVIEKGTAQKCLNLVVIIVMEKDIFRESVQSQEKVVVAAEELAIIVMKKVTCQETAPNHDQEVEEGDEEVLH